MFEFGLSLPVIVVLFLCTLFALNRLLFRPLQAVLDERERLAARARPGEEGQDECQALLDEYQRGIREAQTQGYELQDAARAEAAAARQLRMEEARSEAERLIVRMKEDLTRQVAESKEQLRRDAEEISGKIAAKILQKSA